MSLNLFPYKSKYKVFLIWSGSFYRVEGVRVLNSFNREVKSGWDQPMFTEPGYNGGILGLRKKNINNI